MSALVISDIRSPLRTSRECPSWGEHGRVLEGADLGAIQGGGVRLVVQSRAANVCFRRVVEKRTSLVMS
jgi:hypothetical protein